MSYINFKNLRLEEKRIELNELDNYTENRRRRFRITFTERGGVIRHQKIFQKKRFVKQFIDDPKYEKMKIYVGDIIDESKG